VISYLAFYTPPNVPQIDPRTVTLKEVVSDSLEVANGLKLTHTETVVKAESVNSQKVKVLNRWARTKEVRRSLSDSLQAVVLIDRLNK
jgi:hypothetical protein